MKLITIDEYVKRIKDAESRMGESDHTKAQIMAMANAITQAVKEKGDKPFKILTDYDCDGITSAYILYHTLKGLGAKDIEVICNDRRGSYGVNSLLKGRDPASFKDSVVFVTDMGSNELSDVRNISDTTFIIDHHTIEDEKVKAEFLASNDLLNLKSRQPYADYCTAGLALRIYEEMDFTKSVKEKVTIAVMAMVGTIADVVNLLDENGENRRIVKEGLDLVNSVSLKDIDYKVAKLLELSKLSNFNSTAQEIGFSVAPIFNAPSRISAVIKRNGAQDLMDALLADENDYVANQRLEAIIELNAIRKDFKDRANSSDIVKQCVYDYTEGAHKDDKIVICTGLETLDIPHAICGLVAGYLVSATGKPSIALTRHGDTLSGSGRSAAGSDSLIEYISRCAEGIDMTFGGHTDAIGISSISKDNLERLKDAIIKNQDDFKIAEFNEMLVLKPEDLTNKGLGDLLDAVMDCQPIGQGCVLPPTILTGKAEAVPVSAKHKDREDWKRIKMQLGEGDGKNEIMISDWNYNKSNYSVDENGDTSVLAEVTVSNFGTQHIEFSALTDRRFILDKARILEDYNKARNKKDYDIVSISLD